MPDAATIRKQVQARIAELDAIIAPLRAEYDQLSVVAQSFVVDTPSAKKAAPARSRARRAPAPATAGASGGRAQQALALIGSQPGVSATELAAALEVSRNYLYRVLPKLERSGAIKKQGKGYVATG